MGPLQQGRLLPHPALCKSIALGQLPHWGHQDSASEPELLSRLTSIWRDGKLSNRLFFWRDCSFSLIRAPHALCSSESSSSMPVALGSTFFMLFSLVLGVDPKRVHKLPVWEKRHFSLAVNPKEQAALRKQGRCHHMTCRKHHWSVALTTAVQPWADYLLSRLLPLSASGRLRTPREILTAGAGTPAHIWIHHRLSPVIPDPPRETEPCCTLLSSARKLEAPTFCKLREPVTSQTTFRFLTHYPLIFYFINKREICA